MKQPTQVEKDQIISELIAKNEPILQKQSARSLLSLIEQEIRCICEPEWSTMPKSIALIHLKGITGLVIKGFVDEAPREFHDFYSQLAVTIKQCDNDVEIIYNDAFRQLMAGKAPIQLYTPTELDMLIEWGNRHLDSTIATPGVVGEPISEYDQLLGYSWTVRLNVK